MCAPHVENHNGAARGNVALARTCRIYLRPIEYSDAAIGGCLGAG